MRPIDQQTALVTGATDGTGKALAGELAARGATVLLHGRNEARLKAAVREIRQGTANDRVRPYRADFSGLDEVRKLGERSVTVNALHPATFMNTKMAYEAGIAPVNSIEDSVNATMRLTVSSELDGATGRYVEEMTESRASDHAYNAGARQRLWRLSETLRIERDEVTTADGGKET